MRSKIDVPGDKIAGFCRRWEISEFALFGSVLREDFCPDSDVDVLVKFSNDADWTLFDLVRMQNELKEIFSRDVDIVTRGGLETSRNHIRRNAILNSAEVVHVS